MLGVRYLLLWISLVCGVVHARLPHMVFLLADDFGWRNSGHRGDFESDEVQTPNLRELTKEGLLLNRHYAFKICSPTRSALQTGRLPVHVNVVNAEPEFWNPQDPVSGFAGIPRNMTGVASRLREAGYRTHMSGKWDVGMATYEHTPAGRGYESSLFYFHHANDYFSYGLPIESTGTVNVCLNQFTDLSLNNRAAKEFVTKPATYEEQHFAENSLRVINEHNTSEPLFLFHSFHIVHTPLQIPKEYEDKFSFIDYEGRRKYAAMVHYMDEVVGQLTGALKVRNMWDNTIVWFMSDNGGAIYEPASANNYPLLGGKYSDFEGGVRVNAFLSGGWIPESRRGKVVNEYVHVADVYTTFLALAGLDPRDKAAEAAGLPPVDGVDQSKVFLGTANGPAREEIHLSSQALISGKYKLVTGTQVMVGWQGPTYPNATGDQPGFLPKGWSSDRCLAKGCLFDIFADETEHHDLADQLPDILSNLTARLAELNKSNFNPVRGKGSMKACIAAIKNNGHYHYFLNPKDLVEGSLRLEPEEMAMLASQGIAISDES